MRTKRERVARVPRVPRARPRAILFIRLTMVDHRRSRPRVNSGK